MHKGMQQLLNVAPTSKINNQQRDVYDTFPDTLPPIIILSRYSDSAIIDILQDNHLMIHHDVCLTEEQKIPLKRQSAGILYCSCVTSLQ